MPRYLFLLFALIPLSSFCQQQYTLTGSLQLNTGETFPYKLTFTETDGIIKGFSYTYKQPDDIKAVLTGRLDRQQHTLEIKETEIVYSHDLHSRAYLCLIDARLEDVVSASGKVLAGPINNTEKDRTACTGGNIVFNHPDELQRLFTIQQQFDTVISMKRKVVEPPPAPIPATAKVIASPLTTDRITANIEKSYDWHSDNIILDVWDGGSQDGDRITLLFNGNPMLTHYMLVKEKKRLSMSIVPGVNTLTIIAENEGLQPPNTASIMLYDGDIPYSILAYDKKGEQAIIKIKKVKM